MDAEIIPLIAGVIFLLLGLYIAIDTYRFRKYAVVTQGKIVKYESYISKGSDGTKRTMYRPFFEFEVDGQSYQVKSDTSSAGKTIPVGGAVEVMYHQDKIEKARIRSGGAYGLSILFIVLSIPAFLLGL
ncbi:DUF3592 domain-containing protein [Aliikangiella coralliicola]|uniref:DUF3592 domain-containing protein n=1 Tax=Aliikangiella coralliicola TaxID=2592383 RepID=A0A545U4I3_9GAMM|nr:DUF3592 domain-containing protein [Aliikangiella coralliicola]TQV84390.1 DUF3592 domain-containing protein [Aliikangiella coralliicola]